MSTTNPCDICGWAAAFGAMLAFGSFGAPIKSKVAQSLDIDPLIFQSYKTIMVFSTCWLILLTGEEFAFTPWGIVSGLFWVPGGVATIFAIKNAGLAIAMGVLSSFIVLVSFSWGIFVFREHVHSVATACLAVGFMMLGLAGMAYYSAATSSAYQQVQIVSEGELEAGDDVGVQGGEITDSPSRVSIVHTGTSDDNEDDGELSTDEFEDDIVLVVDETPDGALDQSSSPQQDSCIIWCGIKWKRRTLGIMSAVFTGTYGGSILVPMKWAPDDAKGLGYLISFAIGASVVTLALWLFRYLYLCHYHNSFSKAYYALPSFHIRKMWLYGGACGLMWSIGNVFSIIAVDYLGEGVGYSATQVAMLVSGIWGIFYFKEIQGAEIIMGWFLSALVTLVGIVLLSIEHHEK